MELAPDVVEFSDILSDAFNGDYESPPGTITPGTQTIRVGGGEGDPITGLVPWVDFNLIVLKRHSIWVVNTDPALTTDPALPVASFTIKPIHRRIGTLAPKTFVQVGSDILGLTDQGVRSIRRTIAVENQQDIGPSLSKPIDNLIARINPAHISKCHATYWNNRYLLSVPLDSATSCNYVFVYNTLTESWSGYWTGWNATAFATYKASDGTMRLVFGNSAGRAMEWMDYVPVASETYTAYRDDGSVNVAYTFLSRGMTFGNHATPKTGLNFEVEYLFDGLSAAGAPLVYPFLDGAGGVSAASLGEADTIAAGDLMANGQFRYLQLQIAGEGKLTIRKIMASAFHDTAILQSV